MELSDDEKKILLSAARASIKAEFNEGQVTPIDFIAHPKLKLELGTFVTLKINNQLRGCIGYLTGYQSLFDSVVDAAKQSAFRDPRFSPLEKNELDIIEIEISVLSPFTEIKSYDEIEIGRHGLLLDEGAKAVLLPQVATEFNYTRGQFLTALCHKAGLYGEYWKERMLKIKVFTATVFHEPERRN
jgi:AmmeMemoRadiSam system protein A